MFSIRNSHFETINWAEKKIQKIEHNESQNVAQFYGRSPEPK